MSASNNNHDSSNSIGMEPLMDYIAAKPNGMPHHDITPPSGNEVSVPMPLSSSESSANNELVKPVADPAANQQAHGTGTPVAIPVTTYKTPKNISLYVLKAGLAKVEMTCVRIFALAVYSGFFVGLGSMLMVAMTANINADVTKMLYYSTHNSTVPPATTMMTFGFAKILGCACFPVALYLIVFTGGELFTGNCMYIFPPLLARKCTLLQAAKSLFFAYFGNLCGNLAYVYFMGHLSGITSSHPIVNYVNLIPESKVSHGWGEVFLRGIGANMSVCLAIFMSLGSDDMIGKLVVMWWPIFAFCVIGYEHCIANMALIPLGLFEDSSISTADFITKNLIPATLGNFVGGGIFVGLFYHEAYAAVFAPNIVRNMTVRAGEKVNKYTHSLFAHGSRAFHNSRKLFHPSDSNHLNGDPAVSQLLSPSQGSNHGNGYGSVENSGSRTPVQLRNRKVGEKNPALVHDFPKSFV